MAQGLKQSVVDSTIAFAKRLPLAEVAVRTLAEVAINVVLVAIVRAVFERLAQRANKVCWIDEKKAACMLASVTQITHQD